jgi:hypothetical protein
MWYPTEIEWDRVMDIPFEVWMTSCNWLWVNFGQVEAVYSQLCEYWEYTTRNGIITIKPEMAVAIIIRWESNQPKKLEAGFEPGAHPRPYQLHQHAQNKNTKF